jgi:hypothetical protein
VVVLEDDIVALGQFFPKILQRMRWLVYCTHCGGSMQRLIFIAFAIGVLEWPIRKSLEDRGVSAMGGHFLDARSGFFLDAIH